MLAMIGSKKPLPREVPLYAPDGSPLRDLDGGRLNVKLLEHLRIFKPSEQPQPDHVIPRAATYGAACGSQPAAADSSSRAALGATGRATPPSAPVATRVGPARSVLRAPNLWRALLLARCQFHFLMGEPRWRTP